jgi:hypothetical protein
MRLRQLIPVSFLLFLVLLPAAFAQSRSNFVGFYSIPLEGGRWSTHTITVSIQQSPKQAHDAVLEAMKVWNLAQAWFAQTWFPNNSTYTLVESNATALVQVSFDATGHLINCGGTWANGCTWLHNGVGNRIEIAVGAFVNNNPNTIVLDSLVIEVIAEHEFGHVLGLGHPNLTEDLMNQNGDVQPPFSAMNAPSTLDLYAVHYLISTTGQVPSEVTLPASIGYVIWDATSVPEFLDEPIVLISAFSVPLGFSLLSRKRHLNRNPTVT